MTRVELIQWIGLSHLLQPPLTLLLASPRGLNLRASLRASSALAGAVAHNMAVASVALDGDVTSALARASASR